MYLNIYYISIEIEQILHFNFKYYKIKKKKNHINLKYNWNATDVEKFNNLNYTISLKEAGNLFFLYLHLFEYLF